MNVIRGCYGANEGSRLGTLRHGNFVFIRLRPKLEVRVSCLGVRSGKNKIATTTQDRRDTWCGGTFWTT